MLHNLDEIFLWRKFVCAFCADSLVVLFSYAWLPGAPWCSARSCWWRTNSTDGLRSGQQQEIGAVSFGPQVRTRWSSFPHDNLPKEETQRGSGSDIQAVVCLVRNVDSVTGCQVLDMSQASLQRRTHFFFLLKQHHMCLKAEERHCIFCCTLMALTQIKKPDVLHEYSSIHTISFMAHSKRIPYIATQLSIRMKGNK